MNWVRGAGPAPRGFVGHREGFIDLIPGLLGQLRKFAGKAQCWFCETAFSHHLLFQSQAGLPGVAQKTWGVLILSPPLLSAPYLSTTFPLTAKRKSATYAAGDGLFCPPALSHPSSQPSTGKASLKASPGAGPLQLHTLRQQWGNFEAPPTTRPHSFPRELPNIKCSLMSEVGWPGRTSNPS